MAKAWGRLPSALVAGAVAITANTLALKAADLVPLATARGGLLRMIRSLFPGWLRVHTGNAVFQIGFHLFVGMLMALAYAYAIEPALKGGPWTKGLLCALALWLLNALFVQPMIGEGFAGSAHLGVAGMIWFAAAHTLFFVWLSVMYAWLCSGKQGA